MFYQEGLDRVLRFGDVVRGYISSSLTIKKPILSNQRKEHSYKIDIEVPQYSVVLTPCCSIGDNTITLTPLMRVFSSFFKNPYFAESLLRINQEMTAEQAVPPKDWKKLPEEERLKRLQVGKAGKEYAFAEYFIYAGNDIFDEYEVKKNTIKNYMIDFKNVQVLKCSLIKRPEMAQLEDTPIIDSKVLQLTVEARRNLREKLAAYYARVPAEDTILEE